jgi:hypothetical protein
MTMLFCLNELDMSKMLVERENSSDWSQGLLDETLRSQQADVSEVSKIHHGLMASGKYVSFKAFAFALVWMTSSEELMRSRAGVALTKMSSKLPIQPELPGILVAGS